MALLSWAWANEHLQGQKNSMKSKKYFQTSQQCYQKYSNTQIQNTHSEKLSENRNGFPTLSTLNP